MITILIADDEALARRVLRHQVEDLDLEVRVVGVAADGREAVEKALALQPDVALLDVRMPELSGIEAARQIRAKLSSCAIILISAYREFDFVKEAMQSGAQRYLVKPVDPAALREALGAAAGARDEALAEARRREELLHQLEQARPMVETAFVTDLIGGNMSSVKTAGQIAGYLGKQLPNLALLVDVDEFGRATRGATEIERQALIHQVAQAIHGALAEAGLRPDAYLMAPTGRDALVVLAKCPASVAPERWALTLGRAICGEAERRTGEHVTVGIGAPREDPLLLWVSYREACTAERFKTILGKGRPIFFGDLATSGRPDAQDFLRLERLVAGAVRSGNAEEARRLAGELVAALTTGPVPADGARDPGSVDASASFLAEMAAVICRQMLREDEDVSALWGLKRQHTQAILSADTPDRLALTMEKAVTAFAAFAEEAQWARSRPGVEAALRYIQANFTRAISLADVADAVHLSPFYLTRLLKEHTCLSFVQYLTKIRIQRARELLTGTSLSVGEIARAIGYASEAYFSKVFKKETGQSPSQLR